MEVVTFVHTIYRYLNDAIRSPYEIMPLLNIPLVGTIPSFGNKHSYKNKLIAWIQPGSTVAQSYRALRMNLLYRENHNRRAENGGRIYLVTSSAPGEGKSVTLANLAVTFAITGMRVLVLDTDLRHPAMHHIFELPNTTGLSNIWATSRVTKPEISARTQTVPNNSIGEPNARMIGRSIQLYLSHITQKTAIPGLEVITSGPIPPNPAGLLDTIQMRELIAQVVNSRRYDAVFFDTPPALVVSDCGVLANITRGQVILVVESGRTRRTSVRRSAQNLAALSVNVAGVVVNRFNVRDLDAGSMEYYCRIE